MTTLDIICAAAGTILLRVLIPSNTLFLVSCFILGASLGAYRGMNRE